MKILDIISRAVIGVKTNIRFYWVSFVVFIILSGTSVYIYIVSKAEEEDHKKELFEFRTQQASSSIIKRLSNYIQILKGAKGLYNASEFVSRKEWREYYEDVEIYKNYPGIQGIGFAKFLRPQELDLYIKEVQQEGFPDYAITPKGERNEYAVVTYLEPFDLSNSRTIGFDMYSEPVRRKAMEIAWRTSEPVLSGKVTLKQDDNKKSQPGFLLYLPIYQNSEEPKTIKERYDKLKGFVYNPFRMQDLMNSILADDFNDIDIEIYDGDTRDEKNKLFDKVPSVQFNSGSNKTLYRKQVIQVAHQSWSIYFSSLPEFFPKSERKFSYLILIGGLTISLLVFIVMIFFSGIRRAQEVIVKGSERTKFLTEAMPQKVWQADEKGDLNYFNNQCLEYSGKDFEELKDLGWHKIVHPDDLEETRKRWAESIQSGSDFQLEHRLRRFDNEYRWHLIRAVGQKNKEGKTILWIGTSTDIHDQKLQREQLQKTNADLDNFVYTASHDLKAPVSNIEGLVNSLNYVLKEKPYYKEDCQELITMIDLSIKRFQNTLKSLTEISKIQRNIHGDIEAINFIELVEEVKADLRLLIEQNNAVIHTDISECSEVNFSKMNLKSIIYNLLTNAIKYRSPDRNSIINIKCKKSEDFYIVEVKDNGLGIRVDQQKKIFVMFQRAHSHVEGTGVGLYLVKRIVDNSGGKIELESEEGKGATFRVYLKIQNL